MKYLSILITVTIFPLFLQNVNAQQNSNCYYNCPQFFKNYIWEIKKECKTIEACKKGFLEKPQFESCKSCNFERMWKDISQCDSRCSTYLPILLWERKNPCRTKDTCKEEFFKDQFWFEQCNACNFEHLWETTKHHLPPVS